MDSYLGGGGGGWGIEANKTAGKSVGLLLLQSPSLDPPPSPSCRYLVMTADRLLNVLFAKTTWKGLVTEYSTYRGRVEIGESVSALSAGAYTTTLYMMVDVVKGDGCEPPPSPGWADCTILMECTPANGRCHSVYSLDLAD